MRAAAAVVLAAATAAGAAWPAGAPALVAALLGVGVASAAWSRHGVLRILVPAALLVAVAAVLAGRASAGLVPPPAGPVAGVATVVGDPRTVGGSVAATVSIDGRRWEAVAHGSAGGAVRTAVVGERLQVVGRTDGTAATPWLRRRHVVGRLVLDAAERAAPPPPLHAGIARLRAAVVRGSAPLGGRAPLLHGLVLGDDHDQGEVRRSAFRSAGLSHLTAVSGQNVAFVLAVAAPLLRWLPRRARLAATLVVLGTFVVLTRAEPSVLRAGVMAALAVVHAHRGVVSSGIQRLAVAVVVVLLLDPLLVTSLGLWLSVCATAGIVLLGEPLADRLPGPESLRRAAAITVAAQLATAPLLVSAFGGVPVAALPANLLAVPVAGALMVWGLTAGLLAGVVGGSTATVLHLPTAAGLWWLDGVASRAAAAPLGDMRGPHVAVAVIGAGLVLVADLGGGRRALRRVGGVLATTAVVAAAVGPVGGPG